MGQRALTVPVIRPAGLGLRPSLMRAQMHTRHLVEVLTKSYFLPTTAHGSAAVRHAW